MLLYLGTFAIFGRIFQKKNQNGLIRFKISKLVKLILNFLFVKFYDPGSFTLAVIVKTLIGT